MDLADLLDRQQIVDVLHRYCRAVDRGDRALMRSVYHDDAIDRHGAFDGSAREFVEADLSPILPGLRGLMHSLANVLVEFDRPSAFVESHVTAHHRLESGGVMTDLVIGGRYLDRFEQRGGEWRIALRQAVYDWAAIDGRPVEWQDTVLAGFPLVHGTFGSGDPWYRFRAGETGSMTDAAAGS
jgi:hypothetical protein